MSFSRGAPYKKYQCRYFDETGRPLTPCKQGDRCRFVHPEDPQWPGVKCYPYVHKNSNSQPSWAEHDRQSSRRFSSPPGSRGGPLVPQGDLFRRCKVEEEDISLSHVATEFNGKHDMASNRHRVASSHKDGQPFEISEGGKSTEQIHSRGPSTTINGNTLNKDNHHNNSASILASDFKRPQTITTLPTFPAVSEEEAKGRSERFVSMFRDVAMVSSQIIQDTVLLDQEERKLQTFNEISSTLAKISASSAASVAGPIADILLAHAQSKERLDENFRLLGAAWEKVFNSLMVEFSTGLENRLQAALALVKNEAEIVMNGIRVESNSLKRRSDRASMSPEPDRHRRRSRDHRTNEEHIGSYGRGRSSTRDRKRRKLAPSSRSCSPDSGLDSKGEVRSSRNSIVKVSLDDILNQMKMKIDQQTNSLQQLSKENEELKSKLQSPPQGPKSQRTESGSGPATSSASGKKNFSHAYESETRHPSGYHHSSRSGYRG
ncbi:MAG: hypothetical protein NXY57DRAFT_83323 [Lentinula lateritia]|uniref:C3H1-type domain-containing protein n=1 Tax=Lentinula lateritia TaxID=40482 RepID=A0ABQ8VIS9_9AGAR|nr:MAG: hypothetical protein NXY57DRAFT_83323 [Lentinula lateritia]KAJ4495554.1 hypothetical protein C8R41DRAFT_273330 [Lentinula lateritia]